MSYTLRWSTTAKPNIIVAAGSFDNTSTSLTLCGKGALNYGETQQTNFIRLLENFAGPTPPPYPTLGQSWYNTTTGKLTAWGGSADGWKSSGSSVADGAAAPTSPSVGDFWWNPSVGTVDSGLNYWNGTSWAPVAKSNGDGKVKVAYIDEYNAMATKYNKVAGVPSGTTFSDAFGYGQTPVPLATTTLTNVMWLTLLNKITAAASHQGLSASLINGISTDGFIYESDSTITRGIVGMTGYTGNGTTITDAVGTYATTVLAVDSLTTNRFNAALASLESTSPTGGAKSRTTSWTGTVTHEILLTFDSAVDMKAYFNSGGKVSIATTIANTPTSDVNTGLSAFIASIGTITFSASGTTKTGTVALGTTSKGLYDLTTASQPLFIAAGTGAYSSDTLRVNAILESSNKVLHISVVFGCAQTCTAATSSAVTLTKASEVFLDSPEIAYPVVTSSGTL